LDSIASNSVAPAKSIFGNTVRMTPVILPYVETSTSSTPRSLVGFVRSPNDRSMEIVAFGLLAMAAVAVVVVVVLE
jgi:hypothetical protein